MLKRILLSLALTITVACISSAATIDQLTGGNFQLPDGTPCAGCYLYLVLSSDANIIGTAQIISGGSPRKFLLDANGSVVAGATIWGNDQLSPANTYYIATVTYPNGGLLMKPQAWSIVGASPINLTGMTATVPSPLSFPSPVLTGANNNFTGLNTFTQTIQGTITNAQTAATAATASVANTLLLLPSTFAALPTASNGTLIYCSDCVMANPCAGGGTGTVAARFGGVWNCGDPPSSAFSGITGGTNTGAAMIVGTGGSLAATGSGTIAATSVPLAGVNSGTSASALTIGTGGSLGTSGTGIISATSVVTSNPATCTVGQTFYNTTTGQFLACTAMNTLTLAGGFAFVSSIPATCTPGTTQPVMLNVVPYTIAVCVATNVWSLGNSGQIYPAVQPAIIDPSGTFTITSGSANVTDTNVTFTQANVGNLVAASNWTGADTGYPSSVGVIASGTTIQTVTDSHHIVLSANATGNAGTTNGNVGIFAYGPDGQPAVHAAVVNALTNQNYCGGTVILPSFPFFMSTGENTAPTCPGMEGGSTSSKYAAITTIAPNISTILLPPGFTCPSSPCFGGQQGVAWTNITWNGLGQNINVITHNLDGKKFFATANDGTYMYLSFFGIDASNSTSRTMSCVQINSGYHAFSFITIDGCGDAGAGSVGNAGLEVPANNSAQTTFSSFVGNTGGNLINVGTNAILGLRDWTYTMSANTASGIGIDCQSGSVVMDYGGQYAFAPNVGSSAYFLNSGCSLELNNVNVVNAANAASQVVNTNGTAFVRFRDSRFLQGGSSAAVFNPVPSTATVLDGGGNSYGGALGLAPTATCTGCGATGTVTFGGSSTNERGNFAINAAGAAPAATGTVVITQTGTFTLSGAVAPCTYTLTQTGASTAWAAGATTGPESGVTTTARTITWTNNATALTAGNSYQVNYVCNPR